LRGGLDDGSIASRERLVTDAEVFQEILQRYTAIRRTDAIGAAFDALLHVVDDVHDVGLEDVVAARHNLAAFPGLSARDFKVRVDSPRASWLPFRRAVTPHRSNPPAPAPPRG